MCEEDQIIGLEFKMKMSELAERYSDMVEYAKELVAIKKNVNDEQRNLLSVAYKNVIGVRRTACRAFAAFEQKYEQNEELVKVAQNYRSKIEQEVEDICHDIISLLDDHLIDNAIDDEAKVFFYKMKGDYYRYRGEFKDDEARKEIADKSEEAYKKAHEFADTLVDTNPIKLGLALNFSVFYYEIRGSPEKACKLAKLAFDKAISSLDNLTEESYKDTTLIVQLLRDNLTLWANDVEEDLEDNEDE